MLQVKSFICALSFFELPYLPVFSTLLTSRGSQFFYLHLLHCGLMVPALETLYTLPFGTHPMHVQGDVQGGSDRQDLIRNGEVRTELS